MPNQASGLRFDIFERVHLDSEIQGIETLEELELVPNIEVETQDEQALLRGHLLLSAQYSAEGETREAERLEHQIPVEITLPMSRVQNVQDIGIRIDHFDVDLVSPKSLNVTGVLSLSGIEVAGAQQSAEWDREDVFVHEAQAEEAEAEAEAEAQDYRPSNEEAEATIEEEAVQSENDEIEASQEAGEDEQPEIAAAPVRTEPKIAFTSQKASDAAQDLNALISKAPSASQAAGSTAQERAEEPAAKGTADALEWKKLFLTREAEDQQFSQMRLCIVQKEETLEGIAERYGKNPRELVLFNRLGDQAAVQEGQIIYIPR